MDKVSAIITRSDDNFLTELPASATWKYAGRDALASIEYAAAPDMPIRTSYYAADEFMEIIGSEGVLWVTRCTGEMLDLPPLVPPPRLRDHLLPAPHGLARKLQRRRHRLHRRHPPEPPAHDGHPLLRVPSLRAIIAIYQSSDTTQWVHPSHL